MQDRGSIHDIYIGGPCVLFATNFFKLARTVYPSFVISSVSVRLAFQENNPHVPGSMNIQKTDGSRMSDGHRDFIKFTQLFLEILEKQNIKTP